MRVNPPSLLLRHAGAFIRRESPMTRITMRRMLRALVFAMLPVLASASTTTFARCELCCAKASVNAGVVYSGTRLKQSFTLVNRGTTSVEIAEARASCGCLTPRLTAREIKPGDEVGVELEINTLSQPSGPNSWTVQLRYRERETLKETTLRLSAQLISEVMVEPAAMVLLADKSAGHEVKVTDTRSKPFKLIEARASSTNLQTLITGPQKDKNGDYIFRIAFNVSGDYPVGRHDE